MSYKSTKRKPMAEINVVPYIDVTLVLLIIFMITAPLIQTGVEVDLPQAEATTVEQKDEAPVIVSVNKDGQYFIDIGENENEPVQPAELYLRVKAIRKYKPNTQVYVRGDQLVDYGKVVVVMAQLKKAGVPNVGLMTQPME